MDATSTTSTRPAPLWWGWLIWALLFLATLLAVAGTFAQLLARGWWVLELSTHFTPHWAVALVVLTIGWALARHWRWMVVCVLCLVWHTAQLVPLFVAGPIAKPTGPMLRVVSQNVFTHNDNYQAVFDLVERERPDILFLIESNRRWQREMAPLEATYPYTLHVPSRSNFGLAIYAKEPWSAIDVVRFGRAQLPSLVVHLDTADGPLQVVATHTVPPISANYSSFRNEHLLELGEWIAASGLPTLLVGDLNTTPWSPAFQDLAHAGNLRNTQRGYGITPTWTAHNMPGIPIDHALVTRGVAIGDRRIGPPIGSDHRGVIVDFAVAPEELQ